MQSAECFGVKMKSENNPSTSFRAKIEDLIDIGMFIDVDAGYVIDEEKRKQVINQIVKAHEEELEKRKITQRRIMDYIIESGMRIVIPKLKDTGELTKK